MDKNLSIGENTSVVSITINNDPARVISFDISDLDFSAALLELYENFTKELNIFDDKIKALEADGATDANGLPLNVRERVALIRSTSEFVRGKIDGVFGPGSSAIAFGAKITLDDVLRFGEFFEGIGPYIKQAAETSQAERIQKMSAYLPPANGTRKKHKVTKAMK